MYVIAESFFPFFRPRSHFVTKMVLQPLEKLNSSVRIVFDFVSAHNPMFRCVSFFHNIQFEILVSNFSISYTIIARWFASFRVDLAKSVVTQFVHEAVEQGLTTLRINPKFSRGSVIVPFFDVFTLWCTSTDPYHPQEFVDIIR